MALIDNYSKEELEQIVQQSTSFLEVLRKLGYTSHGGQFVKSIKEKIDKIEVE